VRYLLHNTTTAMTNENQIHLDTPQHAEEEEEPPPFALTDCSISSLFERSSSQQSESIGMFPQSSITPPMMSTPNKTPKFQTMQSCDSQNSAPPGLVESIMTDGSSSLQSAGDGSELSKSTSNNNPDPRFSPRIMTSTLLMSSLQTVHSEAGESSFLFSPNAHRPTRDHEVSPCAGSVSHTSPPKAERGARGHTEPSASVGFSQLLHAADDANIQLGLSTGRMAPVPEEREVESSSIIGEHESGALIVEPIPENNSENTAIGTRRWLPSLFSARHNDASGLGTPLLAAMPTPPVTHLLSNNTNQQFPNTPLEQAKETVQAVVEDDQSFEVSMLLGSQCTVDDVMRIIGNADLLRLWCDPIETLIVTNASDGSLAASGSDAETEARRSAGDSGGERGREYEGEWIEATTTALGSPPSSVGFLYSAGQKILESMGIASYGRITMFVERRRGQVGLTVGPFHGGVHASHTISVAQDPTNGGKVKVVDRVRLIRDEQEVSLASFFWCGAFESCLSRCVLPSVVGYLSLVTTSMARLRLLVENSDLTAGNSIMVVNAPRWK